MLKIDKWNSVQVGEQNGFFCLESGWEGSDGDFMPSFITEKVHSNGEEKRLPKRISLGNKDEMRKVADILWNGDVDTVVSIGTYAAVRIEKYNDVYSLMQGFIGRDGAFKLTWVIEEFGKERTPKNMPKRIKIGDIDMLKEAAAMLYDVAGKDPHDVPSF